jgi:hypothetical protein
LFCFSFFFLTGKTFGRPDANEAIWEEKRVEDLAIFLMMMMRLCWDFYILSYIVYRVGRLLRFLYDGPAAAETFHRAAARPLLRP